MKKVTSEWMGRRWFEFRTGYGTYISFAFGFSNFILILYGLTDFFKDVPLHLFGIAIFSVLLPLAIIIGYEHNRIQQKTESRQLQHLHPYNNRIIPESKEVLYIKYFVGMLDWMIASSKDKEVVDNLAKIRRAYARLLDGEEATTSMSKEGI